MLHAAGGFFGRFGGRCGTFWQGVILEIPAGRSVLWSNGFAEFGRSVGFWTSGFQVVSLGRTTFLLFTEPAPCTVLIKV
jgi:hypothetical protein